MGYGRASRAFLTTDLVGQNYLGYLVPMRSQLFLVKLEKANKQQQMIFGTVTSIMAKEAVNLSVSIANCKLTFIHAASNILLSLSVSQHDCDNRSVQLCHVVHWSYVHRQSAHTRDSANFIGL